MNVRNVHTRIVTQPKSEVLQLFATLATKQDKIWPHEYWPAMRFKNGLMEGAEGGHGPIRYRVIHYDKMEGVAEFEFQKPKGFNGTHKLEINALDSKKMELKHTLAMKATGIGILTWTLAFRWLHDALIEDAFDKVENHFDNSAKRTAWSPWVKFLRNVLG